MTKKRIRGSFARVVVASAVLVTGIGFVWPLSIAALDYFGGVPPAQAINVGALVICVALFGFFVNVKRLGRTRGTHAVAGGAAASGRPGPTRDSRALRPTNVIVDGARPARHVAYSDSGARSAWAGAGAGNRGRQPRLTNYERWRLETTARNVR